jgi:hypothetical protein
MARVQMARLDLAKPSAHLLPQRVCLLLQEVPLLLQCRQLLGPRCQVGVSCLSTYGDHNAIQLPDS